jgi:hypothetical protein
MPHIILKEAIKIHLAAPIYALEVEQLRAHNLHNRIQMAVKSTENGTATWQDIDFRSVGSCDMVRIKAEEVMAKQHNDWINVEYSLSNIYLYIPMKNIACIMDN